MSEPPEEEEEAVYAQLSPMEPHDGEEQGDDGDITDGNTGVVHEAEEHAEERTSVSGGCSDTSRLTPSRDNPEDEIPCANCCNFRDNACKAFETAQDMAKLQSKITETERKCEVLAKTNVAASSFLEENLAKIRGLEYDKDRLKNDLSVAVSESKRLTTLNKEYLNTAKLSEKHRLAADDWRSKHVTISTVLLEKSDKYTALELKYSQSVDFLKKSMADFKDIACKADGFKEKVNVLRTENREIKKYWNSVVQLIADISSQCSDELPPAIRERVNKMPIDILKQIRITEDFDDDDADAVILQMNAPPGTSHDFGSPHKSRRGGRGGRGRGVGRVQSMVYGGSSTVVDESMHENLLARKLHRTEDEPAAAASQPAAKSVLGKKTETVKEQQERQKAGLKERVKEMKKEYDAKQSGSTVAASALSAHQSLGGPRVEDELLHHPSHRSKPSEETRALQTPRYDEDMPEIGSTETPESGDDSSKSVNDQAHKPQLMEEGGSDEVDSTLARKEDSLMDDFDAEMPAILDESAYDMTYDDVGEDVTPADRDVLESADDACAEPTEVEAAESVEVGNTEMATVSIAEVVSPDALEEEEVAPTDHVESSSLNVNFKPTTSTKQAAAFEDMTPTERNTGMDEMEEIDSRAEKEVLRVDVPIEDEEEEKTMEDEERSVEAASETGKDEDGSIVRGPLSPVPFSSSKSPSPSKMIQHPKVVELSQERPDADAPRVAAPSKEHQRRENLAAIGLDLSDSDESDNEDETKKKEEMTMIKESTLSKPLFKSPSKSPQKSPLAMEKPKQQVDTTVKSQTMSPKIQFGISSRINMVPSSQSTTPLPIIPLSMNEPTESGPSTSRAASSSSQPVRPMESLVNDILMGAHRTGYEEQQVKLDRKPQINAKKKAKNTMKGEEKEPDGVEMDTSILDLSMIEGADDMPLLRRSSRSRSRVRTPPPPTPPRTSKKKDAPKTPKTPKKTPAKKRKENEDGEKIGRIDESKNAVTRKRSVSVSTSARKRIDDGDDEKEDLDVSMTTRSSRRQERSSRSRSRVRTPPPPPPPRTSKKKDAPKTPKTPKKTATKKRKENEDGEKIGRIDESKNAVSRKRSVSVSASARKRIDEGDDDEEDLDVSMTTRSSRRLEAASKKKAIEGESVLERERSPISIRTRSKSISRYKEEAPAPIVEPKTTRKVSPKTPSKNLEAPSKIIEASSKIRETSSKNLGAQSNILEAQSNILEAPSNILEAPSKILEAPSKILEAPSKILEAPSKILEASSKNLGAQFNILEAPSKILEASSKYLETPSEIVEPSSFTIETPSETHETPLGAMEIDNDSGDLMIDCPSSPSTPPPTSSIVRSTTSDPISTECVRSAPHARASTSTRANVVAVVDQPAESRGQPKKGRLRAPTRRQEQPVSREGSVSPTSSSFAAVVEAEVEEESTPSTWNGRTASTISDSSIRSATMAAALAEKRKMMLTGITKATLSARGGGKGRQAGGTGNGRGGNAGRSTTVTGRSTTVTAVASGSLTSAMNAQVARMSKNLSAGKQAMSGSSRQSHRPATMNAASSSASNESNPSSQQQPQPPPVMTAAVAARKVIVPSRITRSDDRPHKRKASAMSAVEAVAIVAPDARARGQSSIVPHASATSGGAAAAHSADSRLIMTVLNVCKDAETIEKAMHNMDITNMTMATIIKCICRAIMELPQSNTWHVIQSNMKIVNAKMMKIDAVNRNTVIPKAERNLFELLMKIQEKESVRLNGLFDCFYDEYCRIVLTSISTSSTSADVSRTMRCLFFALVMTDRTEGEKIGEARKLFHQILQKKSSQAVCQSLVYLLYHKDTAPLASEILRTELDDDENGGRLLSMHMHFKKDADAVLWTVDKYADEDCKQLATAAFKTPATLEMVNEWWESDMEFVERARENPGSVSHTSMGSIKFDDFYKKLIMRMSLLISPQFRIDKLDRVKMLAELDMPAIDAIDKVTTTRTEDTGLAGAFVDTSSVSRAYLDEGEARVIVLKLHVAMAALQAFYTDRMYGADQREALRLHLLTSIERVHAILERPVCIDCDGWSPSSDSNALIVGVRALMRWMNLLQRLTKNDLKDSPVSSSAENSPVKKRAKRAESIE